ncbi:MAG: hypothetical protein K2N50_00620 [Clostridia bacterium]|nr:hypothetical protein [Clostridia bacterium]
MRGERNKDRNVRKFISIYDVSIWEQIDKLMTLPQYKKTFNRVINDALYYGLPLLIKEAFGIIDEEEKAEQYNSVHSREEEFYGQVVRLFKEAIMNMNIIKAIVYSLFEAKRLELMHQPVSAEAFQTGCSQDTPEFANDYELRELRIIRNT